MLRSLDSSIKFMSSKEMNARCQDNLYLLQVTYLHVRLMQSVAYIDSRLLHTILISPFFSIGIDDVFTMCAVLMTKTRIHETTRFRPGHLNNDVIYVMYRVMFGKIRASFDDELFQTSVMIGEAKQNIIQNVSTFN